MTEKAPYQETQILGKTEEANVEVKPSEKLFSYKTKIRFIDLNRKDEVLISVQAPGISQAGVLQFLMEDRIICIPLMNVLRWETEQLSELKPAHLVVNMKEKNG